MADVISIDFEVDKKSLKELDTRTRSITEEALRNTIRRAFDRIDKSTRIREYTQNSKPAKPEGSTYIRTFNLQKSARRRITKRKLPGVEGEWKAEIRYASYVIGLASQQAEIHKGRWNFLEQAINNVNLEVGNDFDKEMKKASK